MECLHFCSCFLSHAFACVYTPLVLRGHLCPDNGCIDIAPHQWLHRHGTAPPAMSCGMMRCPFLAQGSNRAFFFSLRSYDTFVGYGLVPCLVWLNALASWCSASSTRLLVLRRKYSWN